MTRTIRWYYLQHSDRILRNKERQVGGGATVCFQVVCCLLKVKGRQQEETSETFGLSFTGKPHRSHQHYLHSTEKSRPAFALSFFLSFCASLWSFLSAKCTKGQMSLSVLVCVSYSPVQLLCRGYSIISYIIYNVSTALYVPSCNW